MESAKELSKSAKELNNAEPSLITEAMASVTSVFEYGPDFPLSKLSPSLAKSLKRVFCSSRFLAKNRTDE
jgi:hypothetical protein